MNPKQAENNFKAFLRHICFWEVREGWSYFSDEEIRRSYKRLCIRAFLKQERIRQRPSHKEVQGEESCPPDFSAQEEKTPSYSQPRTPTVRGSYTRGKGTEL